MLSMYAYNNGSKSAKAICNKLKIKRINHKGSNFKGGKRWTIINWGSSNMPFVQVGTQVLNDPEIVSVISNKLKFFNEFEYTDVLPQHTVDKKIAKNWAQNGRVVCRTLLNASGGRGITIAENPDEVIDAKLYVKYFPKKDEYRIHFFDDEIIDMQRKARVKDVPDENVDWQVRNLEGGFIYARENIEVPDVCIDVATTIAEASGLDFGAIDVVYSQGKNEARVLEINTAPGLTGTTLDKYVEAFKKYL